jgi:hypothetical protein
MSDQDGRAIQPGPRVWRAAQHDGGCNTCHTNMPGVLVWVIQGRGCNVQFRLCDACLNEVKRATR